MSENTVLFALMNLCKKMKKLGYLLLLIFNTVIAAGIYYFAARAHFLPIMAIYQILSICAICLYAFLFYRHNNEIGKAKLVGEQVREDVLESRRRAMKLCMVFGFPFVFVTIWDYIYLLLLIDNPLFKNIF